MLHTMATGIKQADGILLVNHINFQKGHTKSAMYKPHLYLRLSTFVYRLSNKAKYLVLRNPTVQIGLSTNVSTISIKVSSQVPDKTGYYFASATEDSGRVFHVEYS